MATLMTAVESFRSERRNAQTFAEFGLYARARPAGLRAVGVMLHPASVTDAWYAAECPPSSSCAILGVNWLTHLQWRLACVLRGASS